MTDRELNEMIDIEKLWKSKHIEVYGNKFFGYSCIVENEKSKLQSITVCGKRFYIPHSTEKGGAE